MSESINNNSNTNTETITNINTSTNNNTDTNANTNVDTSAAINTESDAVPLSQLSQPSNQENTLVNNNEVLPTYEEITMDSNRGEDFETGSDYGDAYYDGVSNCNPSTLDCTCLVICCEGLLLCLSGLCSGQ